METLEGWRKQWKRREEERKVLGDAMFQLEEWRQTEQKQNPGSQDMKDVESLANCVGVTLLQASGAAAVMSVASWMTLSRLNMTPFRKVILTGLNGASVAFMYTSWRLGGCQERFLSHPTSAIAARSRSVIRSKLPDHPVLAAFTAEEDESIVREAAQHKGDLLMPPPPPPPPPHRI